MNNPPQTRRPPPSSGEDADDRFCIWSVRVCTARVLECVCVCAARNSGRESVCVCFFGFIWRPSLYKVLFLWIISFTVCVCVCWKRTKIKIECWANIEKEFNEKKKKKRFFVGNNKKKKDNKQKTWITTFAGLAFIETLSSNWPERVCVSARQHGRLIFIVRAIFFFCVVFSIFLSTRLPRKKKKKSLCLLKINFHWLNFKYGTRRSLFFQPASYSHCHIATGKKNIYFFFVFIPDRYHDIYTTRKPHDFHVPVLLYYALRNEDPKRKRNWERKTSAILPSTRICQLN